MKTHAFHFISFLLIPLIILGILIPVTPAIAQPNSIPNAGVAHVKVAHFAPFASTLDGTSVVVTVNYLPILANFKFGEITPAYVDVPAGVDLHIEIAPTGGGAVLLTGTINLVENTYYTISFIGNGTLQPLELFTQVDDTTPLVVGAKVRLTHLAPVAAAINDTRVDICTSANVVVPGLAGIPYKGFTDPYLTLPPGDHKLKITRAGTSCAFVYVDIPALRLSNGQIMDVFAIGDVIHQPLALVSITGLTFTPPAHVKIGHFASFANTVDGTSVTVKVDGLPILANFKFGDMTPAYIDVSPEVDHLVEVFPTGSSTPSITQILKFAGGIYYTVAAIGNGTLQKLELDLLIDDNTRPASGARVRVAHFAPISANIADTKVDVCYSNNQVVPGLGNLGYKDVTNPYVSLPAGIYHLKVGIAGFNCAVLPIDIPSFQLYDYTVLSVFAGGDLINLPVGVGLRPDQPPILSFSPIIKK